MTRFIVVTVQRNRCCRYIEKDPALERRLQPVYVAEPSVDATISIIRGLKIKYESHHGVRIADGAVVAAARLSDRYITSRFLPDKAIDLLDEACAVVRVELDSEPAVLDSVKRRRFQLQVEAAALRAEEGLDALSTDRLVAVKAELVELQREQVTLEQGYEEAKAVLGQLADTRRAPISCPLSSVAGLSFEETLAVAGEIEDTQWAIEENERKLRVEKAADLRYGELPQLQQRYQVRCQSLFVLHGQQFPFMWVCYRSGAGREAKRVGILGGRQRRCGTGGGDRLSLDWNPGDATHAQRGRAHARAARQAGSPSHRPAGSDSRCCRRGDKG